MKYILVAWAAAFVNLCAAQGLGLGNLPDCAKPCAATLPSQCGLNVQCICSDKDWITGISCCVKNKCPDTDQQNTIKAAQQICDTVKVTLPSAATCPGASATGTSSGGGSQSSTGTSSGTTASSAMMGTSTMTGSSMSGTGTAGAVGGTSSMATTGTSSGATAATPASGAGNQHMAPGLGAGAAILGLALL